MELESYLAKNESPTRKVSAFEGEDAIFDNKKGTLACTPNRVVFVRGDDVIDISLNGVDSIEYSAPSYPTTYLYSAGSFGLLALIGWISGSSLGSVPDLTSLAIILGVIGLITLIIGFFLRRSTIRFRTPNTTYEFASNDGALQDIAHALRGHE